MSTEAHQSSDRVKRKKDKHKRHKGDSDNSTKKRKREARDAEQIVIPEPQPEERATKKHKKQRHHNGSVAKPEEPKETVLEQHSPFIIQTTSFYLPLSPCAYRFPLEGLCAEHISPLLLTYHPPLKGVLLSYGNPRMSEHPSGGVQAQENEEPKTVLSRSVNEYAVTYVWLTVEFLIFRPKKGTYIEGYVSLQNESVLGLLCYNYFNAVIEREKLPKDWKWVDGEDGAESPSKTKRRKGAVHGGGYFVDGEGNYVEGRLVFKVEDFDATPGTNAGAGTISINGTLLYDVDEA